MRLNKGPSETPWNCGGCGEMNTLSERDEPEPLLLVKPQCCWCDSIWPLTFHRWFGFLRAAVTSAKLKNKQRSKHYRRMHVSGEEKSNPNNQNQWSKHAVKHQMNRWGKAAVRNITSFNIISADFPPGRKPIRWLMMNELQTCDEAGARDEFVWGNLPSSVSESI